MRKAVEEKTVRISRLNDALRTQGLGGQTMATRAFMALDETVRARFLQQIRTFNTFSQDNDPYGEHDFGAIDIDGMRVFWKIDYYSKASYDFGSEDPGDATKTNRVLTVMLASDY